MKNIDEQAHLEAAIDASAIADKLPNSELEKHTAFLQFFLTTHQFKDDAKAAELKKEVDRVLRSSSFTKVEYWKFRASHIGTVRGNLEYLQNVLSLTLANRT